jgi:hypothetical protein
VTGAGDKVELLDKSPTALVDDYEDLICVERNFYRSPRAGQSDIGLLIWTEDRGIDRTIPIDLGCPQESNIDQTPLEIERKQVEHRRDRAGTDNQRGVTDGKGQPGRFGTYNTGLIDQFEVGSDRSLGQAASEIGDPYPDEAVPNPG